MPYIGQQPEIGAYKKLDSITAVNGQAAYTLQYNSANYNAASANHLIVSLNGVIQAPQDSYSVSGSTLTFASNLSTGDSIDFILALGDVLNIGTPSDNTVTNDKLATAPTIISKGDGGSTDGAIQLNCSQNTHGVKIKSPPHSAGQSYTLTLPSTAPSADKALITDGSGNLSFGSAGSGYVHLSGTTHTATATLDFTTSDVIDLSKYRKYMIRFAGVKADTGASGAIAMQVFHSGTIQTGNVYKYVYHRHRLSSASTTGGGSTSLDKMFINPSNYSGSATGMEHNMECFVDFTPYYFTMNATGSSYHHTSLNALSTVSSAGIYSGNSSQNVTGFRIFMSANNIMGRIDLYGLTNSLGDNGDW